jgi:hypothetical protein
MHFQIPTYYSVNIFFIIIPFQQARGHRKKKDTIEAKHSMNIQKRSAIGERREPSTFTVYTLTEREKKRLQ